MYLKIHKFLNDIEEINYKNTLQISIDKMSLKNTTIVIKN